MKMRFQVLAIAALVPVLCGCAKVQSKAALACTFAQPQSRGTRAARASTWNRVFIAPSPRKGLKAKGSYTRKGPDYRSRRKAKSRKRGAP